MNSDKNLVGSLARSTSRIKNFLFVSQRSFMILVVFAGVAAAITYVLYSYTQNLLTERLRERMVAIVSTAAVQFDAEDINAIRDIEDIDTPAFHRIVEQLQNIRSANSNIQFAYIMRRTDDPSVVEFVADADSLTPYEELDVNENGIIEDDEFVPLPGDPYEVEEYPVLRDEAFYHPSVDRELQPDQWGLLMAAYAPIADEKGDTVAIVGTDILVDDFLERTQETLLPFLLFVLFLTLLLTLLTLLLVRVWRDRVEAMREIDRQKDELLSIVSHQLATPVSSVKWYLEMMQDGDVGKLTKEQSEHVSTAQSVITDLVDLVQMILDVSRIQLGRMKLDMAETDLGAFTKEILNVIEPKAKEKKVEFNVSLPKKWPKSVFDKRLLKMTIENLLSNAIKYTPEKGKVDWKMEIRDGNLYCEVKDTGCGIPKKDQSRIFTKLFRASNVRDVDGNGFGLYIAKGAVESQDGRIWFESGQGKGTKFMINLPLKPKNKRSK